MDFLLAPDGGSARKARKLLAEQAPGLYRTAGTWPELMAQSAAAYLLPSTPGDWTEGLAQAASRQKGAFWRSSLKVAPRETLAELQSTLVSLLKAAGPAADWKSLVGRMPADSR